MSTLKRIDRVLAPLSWLVALLAVLALAIGPEVIGAKSNGKPYVKPGAKAAQEADPGAVVFADSCGGCHTLAASASTGSVGPNLDDLAPDAATVAATVKSGAGSMPSFAGELSAEQIDAVAQYVATTAGG
jgi:mono/diheme cytochrome c family protein